MKVVLNPNRQTEKRLSFAHEIFFDSSKIAQDSTFLTAIFGLKWFGLFIFIFIVLFTIDLSEAQQKQNFQFNKDKQIQQIKPKKPLRIKLQRNAKGEYSWDITGDNVDEIVSADSRLRKLLKIE
jgi:hypothetical protein